MVTEGPLWIGNLSFNATPGAVDSEQGHHYSGNQNEYTYQAPILYEHEFLTNKIKFRGVGMRSGDGAYYSAPEKGVKLPRVADRLS